MVQTVEGMVTIVQESRFQLIDDDGVAHLFLLSRHAAAEPADLAPLQHRQTRIRVHYRKARNLIGQMASSIGVLD